MDVHRLKVIESLREEIAQREETIRMLTGDDRIQKRPPHRSKAELAAKKDAPAKKRKGPSAAGRKRIAAAQKLRWKKLKDAAKK